MLPVARRWRCTVDTTLARSVCSTLAISALSAPLTLSLLLLSVDPRTLQVASHTSPILAQKILDILSKEVTPPTFADEVQEYRPKEQYYLYARTIGVIQTGITTTQKRFWAGILVRNLIKMFVALGSRGIVVKKVYGRSDTTEGLRLMHDMGFTQIRTTTSHKNFVIDVETSGVEMVLRYEKALNQWRQKYEGDGI